MLYYSMATWSYFFAVNFIICLTVSPLQGQTKPTPEKPVRIGVVGLVHAHVHGILSRKRDLGDLEIVGIAEPNEALATRLLSQHRLDKKLWHKDLATMLDQAKPEAVTIFTSTFDHLEVVKVCAAHGIHVMMEKPLAVSMAHATAMAKAAKANKVQLLVNYETTWYRSNHHAYALAHDEKALGDLRKIVVHDGHQGPIEIGCNEEFLEWLTDPVLNGGGALTDFGCYGANLITWLMDNERPLTVTAVTQQIKPDKYPKVDDEATILLTYPKCQGIIQASWNWPYNRKDMEVYGADGYANTMANHSIKLKDTSAPAKAVRSPARPKPYDDPFAYLAARVRGTAEPDELSSLKNNLIVTEILDAARHSANTGQVVRLAD